MHRTLTTIDHMAQRRAWLIDVWGTVLTADFDAMLAAVAGIGSIEVEDLRKAEAVYADPVTVGELSVADAFTAALTASGMTPTPRLTATVDATYRQSLLASTYVFPDAVPFITRARTNGDLVALVSNCGDDTRPLLEHHDLIQSVDHAVLSCEIGVAKPGRAIFDHTVAVLGVGPADATLVDDQYTFCAGAMAAGLHAIRLVRHGDPGTSPPGTIPTVRSFDEIR